MSLSTKPFAATTTEPLIPLMIQRYGWTPRVCRDRITLLRQTVLKHKRDGFTQPSKEWVVTPSACRRPATLGDVWDRQVVMITDWPAEPLGARQRISSVMLGG